MSAVQHSAWCTGGTPGKGREGGRERGREGGRARPVQIVNREGEMCCTVVCSSDVRALQRGRIEAVRIVGKYVKERM